MEIDSKNTISLRPYQNDVIEAVKKANSEGLTRLLAVLPTGCGKTIIFADMAKKLKRHTLVIAHRDELIRQAAEKIHMVWPDAHIGIVKGKENDFQYKDVVVASIQTLAREGRRLRMSGEEFGLMIIDEAHHASSDSYQDVIRAFGFGNDNPDKLLFGCTATANRMDGKELGKTFQKIVYDASILTMIRAGYLSDIKGFRAQTGTDISGVQTARGDYVESQLAKAVNNEDRNRLVVKTYQDYTPGEKAIAFCANVKHANDLSDIFNANGIKSIALSGLSKDDERRSALKDFRQGKVTVMTNCALFTEGFDEPSIESVLMCRPTKSASLYAQCIGRGTRTFPGKEHCTVIDFCDNHHDICSLPVLFGLEKMDQGNTVAKEARDQEVRPKKKEEADDYVTIERVEITTFDLLGRSKFNWINENENWRLTLDFGRDIMLLPDGDGKYNAFLTVKNEEPTLLHPVPLDLGYGQGICEDYVRARGDKKVSMKSAKWRKDSPSESQVSLMKKLRIYREGITKGEASNVIGSYFAKRNMEKLTRSMQKA